MTEFNVLSLFDGISCGRLALHRAQIPVHSYFASEVEPVAIKIATTRNPDIIEIGDVMKVHYDSRTGYLHTENGDYYIGKIHLLIGGSPCTDFSSIGYAKGMMSGSVEITTLDQYLELKEQGVTFEGQSFLFWEYARLLREVQPDYFLLENVVMAKKWQAVIDEALGIEPIRINSSLMSAQNRPRLYWTNIKGIEIPEDKNILLTDILSDDASIDDISHCKTVQRNMQRLLDKYGYIPECFNAYNANLIKDKACALSRGSMVTSSCATLLYVKTENGVHIVKDGILDNIYPTKLEDGRYNLRKLSIKEMERLQTLPDDYTNVDGVGTQKRSAAIGNGWTVDVIAYILSHIKI